MLTAPLSKNNFRENTLFPAFSPFSSVILTQSIISSGIVHICHSFRGEVTEKAPVQYLVYRTGAFCTLILGCLNPKKKLRKY